MAITGRPTYRQRKLMAASIFGVVAAWIIATTAQPSTTASSETGAVINQDDLNKPRPVVAIYAPRPASLYVGRSLPEQAKLTDMAQQFLRSWFTYNTITGTSTKHMATLPSVTGSLAGQLATEDDERFASERGFKTVSAAGKISYDIPEQTTTSISLDYTVNRTVASSSAPKGQPQQETGQLELEQGEDNQWHITQFSNDTE